MAAFLHVSAFSFKFMGHSATQSHRICSGGHTSDTSARSLLLSHPITALQTAHACPVPTSCNTAAVGKPIHYPRLTLLRSEYSAIHARLPVHQSDLLLWKRERIKTDSETIWRKPHTFKKKPHEAVCLKVGVGVGGGANVFTRPEYH